MGIPADGIGRTKAERSGNGARKDRSPALASASSLPWSLRRKWACRSEDRLRRLGRLVNRWEKVVRKDMSKVIVERPRHRPPGGWTDGRPRRDEDEGPRCEGMRRRHKAHHHKDFSDNLAPLRR